MRDLVDMASTVSPGSRAASRVFHVLTVIVAVTATGAIVLDQRAIDRAETALWTVAGPPCQRIAPVSLESLAVGIDPGPLAFEDAQGAFVHGGVVCSVIDRYRGLQAHPFTVCQFGSPYVVRLDTPHGEVFFGPLGHPATISFAGGDPHCVLGVNFPAALFDS